MNVPFHLRLIVLTGLLAGQANATEFSKEIKPILEKYCVSCHGPDKQRGSLRLDSARAIHEGGNTGSALVARKSAESLLIKAMLGGDEVKIMPPKGPRVSPKEVALIRRWIDEGAIIPANEKIITGKTTSNHWAFQPIVRGMTPDVKNRGWIRNPIDSFILARLEAKDIHPSPQADLAVLLRRVYLDLIGIPPSPEELHAFLNDRHPEAYERVVDRLLASPHYGERWGRLWLDQARYADSNGYSIDSARTIWKYRDWVIQAWNRDMPFDQFTIEQLAGDLLPGATQDQKVATGFHRNTQINEEGGIDREQFRVEAIIDRVNTTGSVWLGLTVGCAQCHDHKYDPISQKEYYQLFAFFNNSDDPKLDLVTPEVLRKRAALQGEVKNLEDQLFNLERLDDNTLERWVGSLEPQTRKQLPPRIQTIVNLPPNGRNARQIAELWKAYRRVDQVPHVVGLLSTPLGGLAQGHLLLKRQALERRIEVTRKKVPASITTMVVNERKSPRMTTIHLGGDFLRKGAPVQPAVPSVLPPLPASRRLTRLDLARWLVDGKNPLTGRVLVNRLWQHYFGLGLVETENDLGTQGTRPTHPELLDWMAEELVRSGWSMKHLHRLIVTSATYRQSSHSREDLKVIDPRNLLLARQNRLRLDAEIVRDNALAVSGLLTTSIGGPGVFPPQPPGVYSLTQVPKNWVADTGFNRFRRGLYTYFWRSAPHPGLTVFDAPDATATCTRRNRSNTPLQALTLLNDEAYLECAQSLARNLLDQPGDVQERLTRAFEVVLSRRPSQSELRILTELLERQKSALTAKPGEIKALHRGGAIPGVPASEQVGWIQIARVLLNLDEFITRE